METATDRLRLILGDGGLAKLQESTVMVLGLGAICASLSVIAVRLKKKGLIIVFVLCFLCYMSMGYLASREGNSALMNWIEQGVNTVGQVLLLAGVLILHKCGMKEAV